MKQATSLAALLVCVSGCVTISRHGDPSVTADLACETAYAVIVSVPEPPPPPADDKCENCGGTGKVGDGRVYVKCAACDGTGRRKQAQPEQAAAFVPLPPPQPVSSSQGTCRNGVCLL